MATNFQDQVTSLVCEGVFGTFPSLQFVLIEGGLGWLAPLMWRLDRAWRLLRREVPHLDELPSTLIRRHFWATTQPIEEPPCSPMFDAMLAEIGMDDRLLFSTDYPHWDFDSPSQALPQSIAPELLARIFADNARSLYGEWGA
jgi:predicted TIM-barrel fold metal-dependent hydrolase